MDFRIRYQNISDAVSSRLPFLDSVFKVIEVDNIQIDDFLFDLPNAPNQANVLDTRIMREASDLSLKCVDLSYLTLCPVHHYWSDDAARPPSAG